MAVAGEHPRPRPLPRSRAHAAQADFPVDSEYADPGRRAWPTALAVGVLGLVLGLLAGLIYSAGETTSYEATTSISALPDPDLDGNDDNGTNQDATAFIQSQLVVVNGAELAERVRGELNLSARPSVDATQVGQTYVISIVATAPSEDEAVAVAQRTAAGYDAVRTQQLTTDVDSLLTATNRQLTAVGRSLTSARRDADANDPLTPSQTALQTEYERLLSQRSSLAGIKAQIDRVVTLVAPARASSTGLSATTRDSLIGGLLGVIIALALFVVLRRSVRRIRTVSDLSSLGLVTILPVQSRQPWRHRTRPDSAARLLAARLDPELTTGEPLVFVGVTPSAGADHVSASIAAALIDRAPVLYLPRPSDDTSGSAWLAGWGADPAGTEFFESLQPSDMPGVWLPRASEPAPAPADRVSRTARLAAIFRQAQQRGVVVVIEADAISESDMAVDCGRAGASIVLVVARGASTPADVVVATELFAAQSVTFLGAVLNEAPHLVTRLARRPGLLAPHSMDEPAGAHRTRTPVKSEAPVVSHADDPAVDDAGDHLLGYADPELSGPSEDSEHSEPESSDEFDTEPDGYGVPSYDGDASADGRVANSFWRFR